MDLAGDAYWFVLRLLEGDKGGARERRDLAS